MARYHRKALPTLQHPEFAELAPEDRRLVRELASLLRIADGLDYGHLSSVDHVTLEHHHSRARGDSLMITARAHQECVTELERARRKSDLLAAVYGLRITLQARVRRSEARGRGTAGIRGTGGARVVLLLPTEKDTVMAAEVAAGAATNDGLEVHVIPARTAVQGLAAVAVFEPEASVHRNVVEMSAAVKGTSHGAVTIATKEALTSGGHCYPGDALGIVNGDIVIVGADLATVAEQVLHRLLDAGGEVVNLVVGEEGDVPLVETVTADLQRAYPGAEVEVVPGGQPHYPLLIGVE